MNEPETKRTEKTLHPLDRKGVRNPEIKEKTDK